ncbi:MULTISPECIES: hypothetical protein [Streptomyces]|nr:hypothetical protein [Streptomyces venezuelae]APE22398.1 hypothetical protein vnz_16195 [Streptomyces venezuelae]
MPGQRKRKRQRERERSGQADRFGPEAGRWELRYATRDESEWRAELGRLRTEEPDLDWDAIRVDMLCGRSTHPTTYQLSVFVPHAPEGDPHAPESAPGAPESDPRPTMTAPEPPGPTPPAERP